jgi:hypothetical protein
MTLPHFMLFTRFYIAEMNDRKKATMRERLRSDRNYASRIERLNSLVRALRVSEGVDPLYGGHGRHVQPQAQHV